MTVMTTKVTDKQKDRETDRQTEVRTDRHTMYIDDSFSRHTSDGVTRDAEILSGVADRHSPYAQLSRHGVGNDAVTRDDWQPVLSSHNSHVHRNCSDYR